jgi:ABC-2 type transport system ATP-binding protein
MLYGDLDKIRRSYSGQDVVIHPLGGLPADLPGVEKVVPENSSFRLHLNPQVSPQELLKVLVERGVTLERFEIAIPTLDEIFIQVVTNQGAGQ